MAIAIAATADVFSAISVGSTLSDSIDAGSGSDRVLFVVTTQELNSTTDPNKPSGVTYDGVSLTQAIDQAPGDVDAFHENAQLWYLINPASGVNTLEVTYEGPTGQDAAVWTVCLSGVDQSSPVNNTTGESGTGGSVDLTLNITDAANWMLLSITHERGEVGPYTPSNCTELIDHAQGASGSGLALFGGKAEPGATGDYTAGADAGSTALVYVALAAEVVAAGEEPEAALPSGSLALMGVGR